MKHTKKEAQPGAKKFWTHDRKDAVKGYVLIFPAIALLCLFTIYPIFYLMDSSLRDGSLLSKERNFIGLKNFTDLFQSVDFHTTLRNTIVYSIGLVAILMVLATLFAVWVNGKAQKHLNSVTLAAVFTPTSSRWCRCPPCFCGSWTPRSAPSTLCCAVWACSPSPSWQAARPLWRLWWG